MQFVKVVASGNDFIIINRLNSRGCESRLQLRSLAQALCRRKLSVGADGLLVIERSRKADLKMRILNPDGTEVDMCGNGARCLALYAAREAICGKKMTIETAAGIIQAEVKKNTVKIKLSLPSELKMNLALDIEGRKEEASYINTGVPHVVCFVQDLDGFNVFEAGKAIRDHPQFQPAGTNADFVQVLDKGHIRLRTYERGVEAETLSCGTGAVAAGIIAARKMHRLQGKCRVKVDTWGGQTLFVYFVMNKGKVGEVSLEGQAQIVYKGQIRAL